MGIDPGLSPNICVIWDNGQSARWYDKEHTAGNYATVRPKETCKHRNQPSGPKIARIMEHHNPDLVVIEKVWVRPGQGVVSNAKLVFAMGLCDGIAQGQGRNILRLYPTTWLKHHGILTHDKGYHRSYVAQLAPQFAAYVTRSRDHDRADSYLIALSGLAMLDRAYTRAVARGAPIDHTPPIDLVR